MATPAAPRLNLSTASILVTGAASFEVDVIIQILSGFGAAALRRADTLEAARLVLERSPVDFVLIDYKPGDEAALDIIRQIRRMDSDTRQAPVLVATAYTRGSVLTAARNAGADFVVSKPLTPRILFERMSWLAENSRPFIEAASYIGPDRRVRAFGPPPGSQGRRGGDLSPELGAASEPNMSQDDVDSFFKPARVARA